jgi:tight adherence protein C
MPLTVLLGIAAVSVALGLLVPLVVSGSARPVAGVRRNLHRGRPVVAVDTGGGLESRRTGAGATLRVLTPDSAAGRVRRLLDRAGRPPGWTMSRVLTTKLVLAGWALVTGLLVEIRLPGWQVLVVTALVAVGAYHLPEAVLWSRGQERVQLIARELPDTLDQMSIAVAAGLSFEFALARAAGSGSGPLAEELGRTLQDVAVGRPRREAYDALVRRTDVPDLHRFVGAINQAEAYGVPVADVLRTQAEEMRVKRRQRAEAEAMKVPVKVVFPLMLCILPAMLLVVVGPAVLQLMKTLG